MSAEPVIELADIEPTAGTSDPPRLPMRQRLIYACGMAGVATGFATMSVTLVYFYLPPEVAGLPNLITSAALFGVLNAVVLVAAAGRLFDAITDPWVATLSDRSTNPKGRRTPFMRRAAIPAAITLCLMFFPPFGSVSVWNIVWLMAAHVGYFVAATFYYVPYEALLADLTRDPDDRLNLSILKSLAFGFGSILGGSTPALAAGLEQAGLETLRSYQAAVFILAGVGLVFLLIPAFALKETTYSSGKPSTLPVLPALRRTLSNRDFRLLVAAEASFAVAFTILQAAGIYIVTVLLLLDEAQSSAITALIVIGSLFCYPLLRPLTARLGKRWLAAFAFAWLGIVLGAVAWFGRLPLGATTQAYLLGLLSAFPAAVITAVLPAAVTDVARFHGNRTGESLEGMFVATAIFLQKLGRSLGLLLFAGLTTLGRDVGDDFGIRAAAIVAGGCSLLAALLMTGYRSTVIESG